MKAHTLHRVPPLRMAVVGQEAACCLLYNKVTQLHLSPTVFATPCHCYCGATGGHSMRRPWRRWHSMPTRCRSNQ